MLKASTNNFGARSKYKIIKIRSFCNIKSAKITKKCGKIFSAQFFENITYAKHYKITPNERRDQTHLLHIYYFCFLRMPHPSKSMPKKSLLPKICQNLRYFPIFVKKIKMKMVINLFYSR